MWIHEICKTFFSSSMYYHQMPSTSDSVIFINISVITYGCEINWKKNLLKPPIEQNIYLCLRNYYKLIPDKCPIY